MTLTLRRSLRTPLLLALLACVALVLSACGGDDGDDTASTTSGDGGASTAAGAPQGQAIEANAANGKVTLTIGSKNFTEQKILGEVYAQALQAAGYEVKKELNLGDEQTALKAVKGGQVDAYPEYTGTALLSFFDVKTDDLPNDPQKAYEEAKADFAKDDLVALPPTPFTSSNEVAVTQATAKKYGLQKISDLSKVADQLTLYGSPECRQRLDCLLGLQQTYGLKFKKFTPVDVSQRSTVLSGGQADVSIVFTTDPQNARDKFVLLEDDKGIFPPYNSTLVVRKSVAEKAGPDLQKTIEAVNAQLTNRNVQELNARVDLDKETPADAAKQYLESFGFVPKS
ncbi:glycine betaine ABC transporter substrate-binding protein [Patulibacter sp. S7RM1-6]